MTKILMAFAALTLCFSAHAKGKGYKVKIRANCACVFESIDGRLETNARRYGFGNESQARFEAQKKCQKIAPSNGHRAVAESCVLERVKVNRNGNVISIKKVLEEEATLAADLEDLL